MKDLRNEFPAELLTTNSTVIGQPDAGDWGGIYFETTHGGEKKYWLIDKMESNLPATLIPFVEKIESNIESINN